MISAAIERCAGIDVGKKFLSVCVMVGPLMGKPQVEIRKFGTIRVLFPDGLVCGDLRLHVHSVRDRGRVRTLADGLDFRSIPFARKCRSRAGGGDAGRVVRHWISSGGSGNCPDCNWITRIWSRCARPKQQCYTAKAV